MNAFYNISKKAEITGALLAQLRAMTLYMLLYINFLFDNNNLLTISVLILLIASIHQPYIKFLNKLKTWVYTLHIFIDIWFIGKNDLEFLAAGVFPFARAAG